MRVRFRSRASSPRRILPWLAAGLLLAAPATAARANHLAGQSSPYLLQHATNPVDWYPWGEEALRRAQKEDKPIFLSIGYSACHWCHVMEHEVFEDEEVARLLKADFVSIKVDREERPDLDRIYMSAVLAMTGRGGWPMTVFLTPDRQPFFGGTYFPRDDFKRLLASIADGWKNRRQEVTTSAKTIAAMLQDLQHAAPSPPSGSKPGEASMAAADLLGRAARELEADFDAQNGGFGRAPKFPPHGALRVLMEADRQKIDPAAGDRVVQTLDAMERGGIHDQLGGGFHRYATDARWLVPHFEKMLYDNALLVPVYLDAWKRSGREDFRAVAEETLAWVARDMTDPGGGFYATLDADSEGDEGRYYLWTRAEIEKVLGPADGPLIADFFGATAAGNVPGGRNVLSVPIPADAFAAARGLAPADFARSLARARSELLRARSKRPAPRRDDKVLAGWNGLMITACARAYTATGDVSYRRAAERAARFVLSRLTAGGTLRVSWRQGKTGPPGFLDDDAFLARGLLDLHEATGDALWRDEAVRLVREAARFRDTERGGYYFAAAGQADLIVRPKSLIDDALPSGNAVLTEVQLRLARSLPSAELGEDARRTLALAAPSLLGAPSSSPYMLLAAQAAQEETARTASARQSPGGAAPLLTGEAQAAEQPQAAPAAAAAPGAAPAVGIAGADRVVAGTIVGRANPQRVVTASLSVPDRPLRPGQAVTVSLRLDIQKGWHVNSSTPTLEYLIPTRLEFPDKTAARVDSIVYPEPHLVTLKFADTKLSVFEGNNTIRATLRPPRDAAAGAHDVRARLTYQSCSETTCLAPETVEFVLPLRLEGEPVAASEEGPQPPVATAGETPSRAGGGSAAGAQLAAVLHEHGLLALLGIVFLGGLALNLTPCIYPMLPVTIGFFGSQTQPGWRNRLLLPSLYVLGMAVTYSILGVAAGLSGGLFGSTLQSPWIVGGLVILFVIMACGMFGLFEIRMPGSMTRLSGGRRGPAGALVMGLTMGLVAAPCIGPFVVGLLAFVGAIGSPLLGFWLFFVMAVGMGFPNLLLGVFSGSLASLPRSGEWLVYAKKVMGIGMLAVALYFLQPFLGDRVMAGLVILFAVVSAVYIGFLERTRMASRLFPAIRVALAAALVGGAVWFAAPLLNAREEPRWSAYSAEALGRAAQSGTPVLIDFSADWCVACRELERFTFSHTDVLEEAKRFTLLRADLTQWESPEIRAIRDRFGVSGLPTIVFLDGHGTERPELRVYGFEDARDFLSRMRQVR